MTEARQIIVLPLLALSELFKEDVVRHHPIAGRVDEALDFQPLGDVTVETFDTRPTLVHRFEDRADVTFDMDLHTIMPA
jgi:hypothetical protein